MSVSLYSQYSTISFWRSSDGIGIFIFDKDSLFSEPPPMQPFDENVFICLITSILYIKQINRFEYETAREFFVKRSNFFTCEVA